MFRHAMNTTSTGWVWRTREERPNACRKVWRLVSRARHPGRERPGGQTGLRVVDATRGMSRQSWRRRGQVAQAVGSPPGATPTSPQTSYWRVAETAPDSPSSVASGSPAPSRGAGMV